MLKAEHVNGWLLAPLGCNGCGNWRVNHQKWLVWGYHEDDCMSVICPDHCPKSSSFSSESGPSSWRGRKTAKCREAAIKNAINPFVFPLFFGEMVKSVKSGSEDPVCEYPRGLCQRLLHSTCRQVFCGSPERPICCRWESRQGGLNDV